MGTLIGFLVLAFIAYLAFLLIQKVLSEPEANAPSSHPVYPVYIESPLPQPLQEEWIVVETLEIWEERW